jgi:hypothetical protein
LFGNELVYFKSSPDALAKIYLPETLHDTTIAWYHEVLSHPGITCLYNTITANFHCPLLAKSIEEYVKTCHTCQLMKVTGHR